MGAKIKVYGLVFSVLYFVVLAKADDSHHIKQRILEKNYINGSTLESISQNSVPNTPKSSSSINIVKPLALNNENSTKSKNINPDKTKVLLQEAVQSNGTNNTDGSNLLSQKAVSDANDISQQKFNVSCLLRNNDNAVEVPYVFPNCTSVNRTIPVIEVEKMQTMISQTYNKTEKTNIQPDVQNKTTVKKYKHVEINNKNETNIEKNTKPANDIEVKDLLHNNNIQDSDDFNQVPQKPQGSIQIPDKIDDETERIEDGENTEDILRRHPENSKKDLKPISADDVNFDRRYLASILVSSLVAVSVLCYAVLLIWRRYLENRYGSRTMLVDEDDFDDPNDMRHFSI